MKINDLRFVLLVAILSLSALVACGEDKDVSPSTDAENNDLADVGNNDPRNNTPGNNDDAADVGAGDADSEDVVDEDAPPEGDPWWEEGVDHALRPGEVVFPASGSISEPSGADSFTFGVATAATQIEDQNTNVDWWAWSAPEPDGLGNGPAPLGEASRGFSMALQDVDLLVELGVDVYRFSVEWARVEPQRDQVDEAALAHYSAFIDALVERGITPVITIHHFSNPTWVDDPRDTRCANGPTDANLCGWNHAEGGPLVVEEVAEFAGLLGDRFGDRVDVWCTVNEPLNYLIASYGAGVFPPGKRGLFDLDRIFIPAFRNYLEGHARMYDALKAADTVDADGDGEPASVGFTHAVARWAPSRDGLRSNNAEDIAAVYRMEYLYHYVFVDSILEGGFDPDVDGVLDEAHPSWAGKLDWLGVQYYFRAGVTAKNPILPVVNTTACVEGFDLGSCLEPEDPTWFVPDMKYEFWAPGIYGILVDLAERWPNLPMTITESGLAANAGERRAEHIVRSLEQIWRAREEGVDVRGYYHWSLYDNFEWAKGYVPRFGLYTVQYDNNYARVATIGANVYSEIVAERKLTESLRSDWGGLGPMTEEVGSE